MFKFSDFPSNCGMGVLHGFDTSTPTETSLVFRLKEVFFSTGYSIIAFSGNEYQDNDYEWGPQRFAEWLKKKGEKVTKTAKVVNHGTGRMIQSFYWSPSLKFRKKYGMDIFDTDC